MRDIDAGDAQPFLQFLDLEPHLDAQLCVKI